VTEQEAADRLCALLNEIEEVGYEVHYSTHLNVLWVGSIQIAAPPCEDEPWEVRA